ncbi:MAG: hypothetical protein NUW01_13215 [Gemmatimonadaceae bacterium]|nr:hypothetical protein [Gemmatimonadaceae bacterium]
MAEITGNTFKSSSRWATIWNAIRGHPPGIVIVDEDAVIRGCTFTNCCVTDGETSISARGIVFTRIEREA